MKPTPTIAAERYEIQNPLFHTLLKVEFLIVTSSNTGSFALL